MHLLETSNAINCFAIGSDTINITLLCQSIMLNIVS